MADKNIGSLPGITSLDSDSLFVAEQQGVAVKVSGLQLTRFANVETDAQVQAAAASAQAAAKSQEAASASEQAAAASAQEAQDASQAVQDLSVSATSVPNTSPATVEKTVDPSTGAVSLAFSIPEGPTGPAGGVDSFNGRTGAVVPSAGDYNPELVGARPRKNLLRNWYFVGGGSHQGGGQFPINQRGQTSFSPASDAMDGWYYQQGGNSLSLTADGLLFPVDTATQVLRADLNPAQYLGKTATISALFADGTLITATTTVPTSGVLDFRTSYHNGLAVNLYSTNTQAALQFRFVGTPTSNLTAIAAKLEIGEGQTLAYKDSTGAWKLFETLDYTAELLRCQRYLYHLTSGYYAMLPGTVGSSSAAEFNFSIPAPTQMATNLNLSYGQIVVSSEAGAVFNSQTGGQTITIQSIQSRGNFIWVSCLTNKALGILNQSVIVTISDGVLVGSD